MRVLNGDIFVEHNAKKKKKKVNHQKPKLTSNNHPQPLPIQTTPLNKPNLRQIPPLPISRLQIRQIPLRNNTSDLRQVAQPMLDLGKHHAPVGCGEVKEDAAGGAVDLVGEVEGRGEGEGCRGFVDGGGEVGVGGGAAAEFGGGGAKGGEG